MRTVYFMHFFLCIAGLYSDFFLHSSEVPAGSKSII